MDGLCFSNLICQIIIINQMFQIEEGLTCRLVILKKI